MCRFESCPCYRKKSKKELLAQFFNAPNPHYVLDKPGQNGPAISTIEEYRVMNWLLCQ